MRRIAHRTSVVAALASIACAGAARAQGLEGADRLPPRAVAESLAVLHALDDAANRNSKEAALWYHRGMLAWSLWERSRHLPPISGMYWPSLASTADISLRKALELQPDNDEYFLAVARYLTGAGVSFRVYGAYGVFGEQLDNARRSGNQTLIAHAALEAGRLAWLRYDRFTCRSLVDVEGTRASRPMPAAIGPFAFLTPVDNTFAGETDYLKAELLFHEAYDAQPDSEPAFRRMATLLADRKRWRELTIVSRAQIGRTPTDPWPWMALGLATHRAGDERAARAAFDTALTQFSPDERRRLDRMERVLGPVDAANYRSMTDSSRAMTAEFFWRNQQPLWSVDGEDARIEYLARIAFAEMRWTQEELNLNGVSTDVGAYYVRTGFRMGPDMPRRPDDTRLDPCTPQVKAWYFANDTIALPGPAARWTNLARIRIDTIPAQVARFRAIGDSADVVFASMPPVAAIARSAQVKGPVRAEFWLLANGLKEIGHDTIRPANPGVLMFVKRLPPGAYVYRTEASADGSSFAARGTGGVITRADPRTGYATSGFGMSDLLVASRVQPRAPQVRRWTDFDLTPLVGPVAPNAHIALVWENYDFGEDNGSSRYGLSITIQHQPPPPPPQFFADRPVAPPVITSGKIVASIEGKKAGRIAVTRSGDKLEFTFERSAPYSPVVADNVEISLGKTPPGNYLLTLRITDRVTGKMLGRSQLLTIPTPPPPKPCMYCR